jgi:hypothetical protein
MVLLIHSSVTLGISFFARHDSSTAILRSKFFRFGKFCRPASWALTSNASVLRLRIRNEMKIALFIAKVDFSGF